MLSPGWSRRLTQMLMLLAFAGAMFAPRAAFAAFFPVCEARDAMSILPSGEARDEHEARDDRAACGDAAKPVPGTNDDLGDTSVAAMCDVRGASVVAPPRIVPVHDARIEAARSCFTLKSAPSFNPSPDDAPASPNAVAIEPVALVSSMRVPAADFIVLAFAVHHDGPREGFTPTFERPPR